ncbi:MAG: RNAse Z [Chitinophagaceae bacterium]|nr:RNAse Z [Chitinophagaceae bacterium]
MRYTITGYSTALFSTWYFVEELGLLFDAGDGLISGLLQKSRKINHVFISHADRDHLTGLLKFNQMNGRPGFPVIHYPKDSGSFPALEKFSKSFDPNVSGTVWQGMADGEEIIIQKNIIVEAIRNGHVVVDPQIIKSLSYKIIEVKEKLKPQWLHLEGREIRQRIIEHGKQSFVEEQRTTLIGYSGDTPVEDGQRWDQTHTLIHEATFLGGDDDVKLHAHGNLHSTLEEVMEMVSGITIQQLILGHFSSRYQPDKIDRKIVMLCEKYAIDIPVFRMLPGQIVNDILNTPPINR